jgi:hypothetical protein
MRKRAFCHRGHVEGVEEAEVAAPAACKYWGQMAATHEKLIVVHIKFEYIAICIALLVLQCSPGSDVL